MALCIYQNTKSCPDKKEKIPCRMLTYTLKFFWVCANENFYRLRFHFTCSKRVRLTNNLIHFQENQVTYFYIYLRSSFSFRKGISWMPTYCMYYHKQVIRSWKACAFCHISIKFTGTKVSTVLYNCMFSRGMEMEPEMGQNMNKVKYIKSAIFMKSLSNLQVCWKTCSSNPLEKKTYLWCVKRFGTICTI